MASLVFALVGIAFAQQPNRDPKIPGFFNPRTRAFTAKSFPGIIPDLSTKTWKLDTPLPTGDDLVCSATADAVDEGTGNFIEEGAEKKSSVSGSTATRDISIPDSWALATASSDMVSLSYELTVPTSTSSVQPVGRDHVSDVPSIAILTSGATTTLNVSATI